MSTIIMTSEKLHALAKAMSAVDITLVNNYEGALTNWFAENPILPVVLSDKDLYNFADFLKYQYEITLSTDCIRDDIETWFGKSLWHGSAEVKEEALGLSVEQVKCLAKSIGTNENWFIKKITEWQETQTFAQPHQFMPDWDDAPDNAKWLTISYLWSDKNHKRVRTTIMSEQERPKPTPQVEVGQVWSSEIETEGFEVEIICFGKIDSGDSVCYKYTETQKIYVKIMSDFLAQFEKVS